jgi:hypothetical protein
MNKTIYSCALLLLAIILNIQLGFTAGFKMGSRSLEDVMKESNELDAGNLNKPPKLSEQITAASSSSSPPRSKIILKNKEFLFGEEDDDDEVSTHSIPVTIKTPQPEVAADALEFGEQNLHREQRTNKKHAFSHDEMDNFSEQLKQIAKLENRLDMKQKPVDTYESEYYYDFLANELLKNAAENTDSIMKTREFKGPSVNYLDMPSNNQQDLDLDKLILNELLKKSAHNSFEKQSDSIQSPAINFKERIISNSLYNNNLKGHIEESNTHFK